MSENKEKKKISETVRWIILLAAVILLALGIRKFVIEPFNIPSESMTDTIQVGDLIMAQKVTL